jgi:hypothetical protein
MLHTQRRSIIMPRLFHRILSFAVEGEIYDQETKPEDIIKNYLFRFKDYNDGRDKSFLELEHKDVRGRIVKFSSRPKVSKARKPDTEFFVI